LKMTKMKTSKSQTEKSKIQTKKPKIQNKIGEMSVYPRKSRLSKPKIQIKA